MERTIVGWMVTIQRNGGELLFRNANGDLHTPEQVLKKLVENSKALDGETIEVTISRTLPKNALGPNIEVKDG